MAGTPMKSLVALATEKVLLKTSGQTFLYGVAFMKSAGLSPDRVSVMRTSQGKFILQFHSKCDIRPFAANYATFVRVLRGLVHIRAWNLKSIEFVNVPFDCNDIPHLERTIEKLGVELVLLRNCTYPNVPHGDQAIRFLQALNRGKKAVVCEYGDDRLKTRIRPEPANHPGGSRPGLPMNGPYFNPRALNIADQNTPRQPANRGARAAAPEAAPVAGPAPQVQPVQHPVPMQE